MVNVVAKDITTVEKGILINGVNCQGVMGAGVAKAYYTKWPNVKEDYLSDCKRTGSYLGLVRYSLVSRNIYVANCWTQEFYGNDGEQYADYSAVLSCFSQVSIDSKYANLPIYTPWVGCGLGGLNKDKVKHILEFVESTSEVDITVCEI